MESLFKPFRSDFLQLSNRSVMAPMTRSKSKNHIPGEDVVRYYQRRAEAGVGLIITEGTTVNHKAAHGYPDVPNFHGKKALEGWSHVVKAVHEAGGKIIPQLWHVGSVRQRHACHNEGLDNPKAECSHEGRAPGYGPSAIPHPYVIENPETPHEMTLHDISEVIQAFVQAAQDAKTLGFDGIEIHGAHGYLIDQFFWSHTNRRTDKYGGKTLAERTRFAVELLEAVREAIGSEFFIDFRFSQWKMGNYEVKLADTPQELESFLIPLLETGIDIFHCSTRRFWEPEFPNSPLNLAGWTKKITGKPTITVGSVGLDMDFWTTMKEHTSPHQTQNKMHELMDRLEKGEFDLVAIGRALLADPYWVEKVKENRIEEITPFSQAALEKLF